jgi:serine/threonine-protein kinase
MRYIDGPSLAQILKPPGSFRGDPRALARDLLEALAWLHDRGVVFRDVAPGNVLIASDGGAWLSDFGIARPLGGGGRERAGWVTGTLPYMAPEVRRGWPATVRSDLYAAGRLLRECADGRGDASLRSLLSALSAINPALRPASAREAASVLDRAAARRQPSLRQARPPTVGSTADVTARTACWRARPARTAVRCRGVLKAA